MSHFSPSALCATSLLVLLTACSDGDQANGPGMDRPAPEPDPRALQLLGTQGVHLYVQEAYEGFDPDVTAAVNGRYDELVGAGMDMARHLFDWADLEPSPGAYDTQLVRSAMNARTAAGIAHQFCNVVVIDSGGPVVPAHIQDLLDMGVPWNDPQIVDPFLALLDAVVPAMLERDMFLLGLSNEPGGYYEDEPALAAPFHELIRAAVARAHELEPRLSCTVVFAGTTDAGLPDLMPLVDVASFNAYLYTSTTSPSCLFGGQPLTLWHSMTPVDIGPLLDELIQAAGSRLVCIQEIGQATGWNDMPATIGPAASLANQAACLEALGVELEARQGRIRTACLWTLNDHTPDGLQYVSDPLAAAGLPSCYIDNIVEIFGPTGLVRSDANASQKPAFPVFLDTVERLSD